MSAHAHAHAHAHDHGEGKPFCKVCKDAGKSEAEYTSHYVRASREPGAAVVCPTLLSQECAYCHELGHTKKYCPKLKERDARRKQTQNNRSANLSGMRRRQMTPQEHDLYRQCLSIGIPADALLQAFTAPRVSNEQHPPPASATNRGFNALDDDDDDDDDDDSSAMSGGGSREIADNWTKMSHASALRRERDLIAEKERAEEKVSKMLSEHRAEVEALTAKINAKKSVAELERELTAARDEELVAQLGNTGASAAAGKKKKRGGKKKNGSSKAKLCLDFTASSSSEPSTPTSNPITLTINETGEHKSSSSAPTTPTTSHSDAIGDCKLARQLANRTGNWGDDSDSDSDDEL